MKPFMTLASALFFQLLLAVNAHSQTLRDADFLVLNDTRESSDCEHVRSSGKLTLNLEVTDDGDIIGRRLQLFVAVYERADNKTLETGKLIKQHLEPKILVSNDVVTLKGILDTSIKVPKGDYIVKVFLCDPDNRMISSAGMRALAKSFTIPNSPKLPGNPRKMRSIFAHVE